MNIEEAIEILKEIIELHEDNCYLSTEDDFKAIKTLIEAYEKQSKEIDERELISKDKIKAKIEEFKQVRDEILREEKEFNRPMMTYDLKRNDYCEKMLQSLLEEEE